MIKAKLLVTQALDMELKPYNMLTEKPKSFIKIGISPNTTGISVYILGIEDKKYLPQTYSKKIGKASVTGYCIKFKTLKDINLEILEAAIRDGVKQTNHKK